MRGGELFDEATLGFVELGGDKHIDVGDEVAALVLVADVRDAQSLSVTVSSVWQPAGMDTVFSPSNVSMDRSWLSTAQLIGT